MVELPCGCIDLSDPRDPPEFRLEGWIVLAEGCPVHDRLPGSVCATPENPDA